MAIFVSALKVSRMDPVVDNPEADSSMESKRKVGDVPEVAYGEFRMIFCYPSDDQIIHYNIDKVLGLVKKDNSILKFKLI